MTSVSVNTYTHSVTYVADNVLKSLKDVIRLMGLNPDQFVGDWPSNKLAISTWLGTQDLERVVLEIYNPSTDALITRWDMDVVYGYNGDGSFYTDTEQLKFHIRKLGGIPSSARYRLLLYTRAGRPDVSDWGSVGARSTSGLVKQSLGATIDHSGLAATTAYWRAS